MLVEKYLKILQDFSGREDELKKIKRYSLYDVMIYRTNLQTHSKRVGMLLEAIITNLADSLGKKFDSSRAIAMALVHDDAEIIFGDIQAGNKSKMSAAQLHEIEKLEEEAIKKIAKIYPEFLGEYKYESLLVDAAEGVTLEAKVVKYIDKFDAFGEAFHEYFAGNKIFFKNVVNEYGKIPTPLEYYIDWFNKFHLDNNELSEKLLSAMGLVVPGSQSWEKDEWVETPHSRDSLLGNKTSSIYYNWWKATLVKQGGDLEIERLIQINEFYEIGNI